MKGVASKTRAVKHKYLSSNDIVECVRATAPRALTAGTRAQKSDGGSGITGASTRGVNM